MDATPEVQAVKGLLPDVLMTAILLLSFLWLPSPHDPIQGIQPPPRHPEAWTPSTGLEQRVPQTAQLVRPVGGEFPPTPGWTTQAKCVRVVDGDTLEVEVRRVIRVRMLDCWAPESKLDPRISQADRETEKFAGQASKENLRRLAEDRDLIVQIPSGEDVAKSITMGRWLGRVWVEGDGESLAEKQVKGGFAEKEKPERLK